MSPGRHRRARAMLPVAGRAAATVLAIAAVGSAVSQAPHPDPPTVTAPVPARPPAPAVAAPVDAPTPVGLATPRPVLSTPGLPDGRAAVAIAAAVAQVGLPYVWGGDGPAAGEVGFDCSGLTRFAYAAAGIVLPRTAHTQFYAGPRVPPGAPLRPGDLVFYGVPERVHHVGLYLGNGRMVNAPTFGRPVQVAYYRWRGDDYLGATRPAARSDDPDLLPPLPAPLPVPRPDAPDVFEAPPAPLPAVLPGPDDPQPAEPDSAAAALAASELGPPTSPDGVLAAPAAGAASPSGGVGPPDDPAEAGGSRPRGATDTPFRSVADRPGRLPPDGPAPAPAGSRPGSGATPGQGTVPGRDPAGPPPGGPDGGARPGGSPPQPPSEARPAGSGGSARSAPPDPPANDAWPSDAPPPAAPPCGAVDDPASITSLTLPAHRTTLRTVGAGADGLPVGPGVRGGAGIAVVRVAPDLLGGVTVGAPVVVTRSDGRLQRCTVGSRTLGSRADAAGVIAAARALVVVAESPDGRWTVVLAR